MNTDNNHAARVKRELAQLSFAMDELRLFLDTHPNDRAALAASNEVRAKRDTVVRQYERLVGPVNFYEAGGDCSWDWLRAPWPWETEDTDNVEL